MGILGNLMVNLGLNSTQFTTGLTRAATAAERFSTRLATSFRQTQTASNQTSQSLNILARNASSSFKDVGRIAQGIIISQAFYRTTNAIQNATSAVFEFSQQTEQASMSYAILMKDVGKSERFVKLVEDFAARTPFTFQQAADQARKLLAYGFNSANMQPIMNTLADASAASGDEETFHRVGRALGQIRTKGRLASQEILQLTEAGIPAFEILREKIGLSADQMANIGRLRIPADVAINAILKGMQERYGGAANAMANTVSGMLNTVKDNALIIGQQASEFFFAGFRNRLTKLRDITDIMRASVRKGGFGQLMHDFIPADMLPKIQLLAANLKMLRQNVGMFLQALLPVIQAVGVFLINAFNFVMPFLNAFGRILAVVAQVLTSNSQAVRIFVGAILGLLIAAQVAVVLRTLGAVIRSLFIVKALAQLFIILANAMKILITSIALNPWIGLLAIAAGALLYFGLTSKKVAGWMQDIGSKISSAFGVDPSKEFAPKMKDNTKVANEFNQKLKVSDESIKKMGNSAKEAAKKAKDMLMSFDEVFNLKEPDANSEALDSGLNDITDIGTPPIPDIKLPEIQMPDMVNSVKDWVAKFQDTIVNTLRNSLIGAGIGAVIGGVIGGLLGGPGGALIGVKIGALAGGVAGLFWDEIKKAFAESGALRGAAIGGGIGAAIGMVFGGPLGAGIGAALGIVIGGIVGNFWEDIKKAFTGNTTDGMLAGGVMGAAIGMVIGGPMGALIGAALGTVIGGLVGKFWPDIKKAFSESSALKGATIGAGIGAVIGLVIGGPMGAAIGAAIGGVIGSIVGKFWPNIKNAFATSSTLTGGTIGAGIGGVIGLFIGGPMGAAIGAALGAMIGSVVGHFWVDIKKFFTGSTKDGAVAGGVMGATVGMIVGGPMGAAIGAALGTMIGAVVGHFWKNITGWFKTNSGKGAGTGTLIGAFIGTLIGGPLGTALGAALGGVIGGVTGHFWKNIVAWWKDASTTTKSSIGIGAIIGGIIGTIICPGIGTALGAALGGLIPGLVSRFWTDLKKAVSDVINSVGDFFGGSDGKIKVDVVSGAGGGTGKSLSGHASGGVFNKEHIARFAEGGRAEAIIPLDNSSAMQPFVDAVSAGLSRSMGDVIARVNQSGSSNDSRQILYVGTLIADDRSLKELNRKMRVITLQEDQRR